MQLTSVSPRDTSISPLTASPATVAYPSSPARPDSLKSGPCPRFPFPANGAGAASRWPGETGLRRGHGVAKSPGWCSVLASISRRFLLNLSPPFLRFPRRSFLQILLLPLAAPPRSPLQDDPAPQPWTRSLSASAAHLGLSVVPDGSHLRPGLQ